MDKITKEIQIHPDHDLLIELKTRMEALRDDIRDLKEGTTLKIADHGTRIFALENSRIKQSTFVAIGIFGLVAIITLLIYHLTGIKI